MKSVWLDGFVVGLGLATFGWVVFDAWLRQREARRHLDRRAVLEARDLLRQSRPLARWQHRPRVVHPAELNDVDRR